MFNRHESNPILSAKDWPYSINTVFNAGATLLQDGRTLLLCRCEDFDGRSHLCKAISDNGIDNWEIDEKPTLDHDAEFEEDGVEDPRITWVPELKSYLVVYTSCSRFGPGVSIACTTDFESFEKVGQVFFAENKDAFVLPRRVDGYWVMYHRPVIASGNASIWVSYSPDLIHWGQHVPVLEGRGGRYWDSHKVGASTPMIETDDGWLMLYHSGRYTPSGCLYRCGLALFDLLDPSKLLLRGEGWVFGPEASYERSGDVSDVVFPCGVTVQSDEVKMYYGASDTSMCLATAKLSEMLSWLKFFGLSN